MAPDDQLWEASLDAPVEGSARGLWDDAAVVPLRVPPALDRDLTCAVDVTVHRGVAAVGTHTAGEVVSEVMVEACPGELRTVLIPFRADPEGHRLVVRNGRPGPLHITVWSVGVAGFVESLRPDTWRRSIRSPAPGMVYDAAYEGTTAERLADAEQSGKRADPEWRLARLRRVVELAYRECRGYREHWAKAGWHPADLRTIDDAHDIPPVSKALMRRDVSSFTLPRRHLRSLTTSGSTAEPFRFFYSRALQAAQSANMKLLLGATSRDATVMALPASRTWALLRVGHSGTVHVQQRLRADEALFARVIQTMEPDILYGWPSVVVPAAEIARTRTEHRFSRVVLASEGVLEGQLARILEVADSVAVGYGTSEGVGFAERCPECGHYVERAAFGLMTLRPRPDGMLDVIGSSFVSLGTLFVAYETGDVAHPATTDASECSCPTSVGVARFGEIAGRAQDVLRGEHGDVSALTLCVGLNQRVPGWVDVDLFDFLCSSSAPGRATLRYQTQSGHRLDEDGVRQLLQMNADGIDFEVRHCPGLSAERDPDPGRKWRLVKWVS